MAAVLLIILLSLFAPHNTYAASPSPFQVDRIDHTITPVYGGLILINDTVKITPTSGNLSIETFSIGFSQEYKKNLNSAMAFDAEDPDKRLNLTLDTGLGMVGYYGVTVSFPNEVRDLLHDGHSYEFTTTFILSGTIESSTKTVNTTTYYVFTADFPVYPSLSQSVSTCNVEVVLPENTKNETTVFPFNVTQKEERYYLNYTKSDLPAFTRTSAKASFRAEDKNAYASFSTNKLTREIAVGAAGQISCSDLYLLESHTAFTVGKIRLLLPEDVVQSSVAAFDELGKKLSVSAVVNKTATFDVTLDLVATQMRSVKLTYDLPKEHRLSSLDNQNFKLNLSLYESLRTAPKTFLLKVTFPEGATVQSFPQQTLNIQRDTFRETLSLSISNATWLQKEQLNIEYRYTVLWEAFRPTLWATSIVVIGSLLALVLQRPKAPVSVVSTILVPRKTLNDFVEGYEEKKRMLAELEQMKRKALKGKVSRRDYKVRKTTLESRLSSNSKKLAELRQRIYSGGAKYAEIMRQLEVAETELDNIDADIRRIETRFKSGEISAVTYRQLLEDDLRRKEKAQTTIDGAILRLRE